MAVSDSEKDKNKPLPKKESAPVERLLTAQEKEDLYGIQRVIEKNQSTLDDSKNQLSKMEGMINSMRTMQNDIESRVEELKRLASHHHIDLDAIVGGVNSLALKENQVVHAMENAIKKKIEEILLPETCLLPVAESKDAMTKKRLGKTRGARNKWLPMR
jgi:chromosome segregation ATPase